MQKKKQGQSLEHQAPLLAGDSPFISIPADVGFPADRKVINGGSRHEKLNGTRQSDTINGKGGNDVIDGKQGYDKLYGGDGKDTLIGGGGYDRLDGGAGNDMLSGGQGNDTLIGGAGINRLSGGSGVDTAVFKGRLADAGMVYDAEGRLSIVRSGSRDMLDDTVELLKFGSDMLDRRVVGTPTFIITTANGELVSGATTVDTTLEIAGTASRFARIVLMDAGVQIGVTMADEDGNWRLDLDGSPLSEGAHSLSVSADYGAGLPAATSAGTNFTFGHVVDLTNLDASRGFIIRGIAEYDQTAFSVSSAGDINGDGISDIIIGVIGSDQGHRNAGGAYVIFGTTSGFGTNVSGRQIIDLNGFTASQGIFIQGDAAGDGAGWSVSSAGDVNGDGFDDIIVGAMGGDDGAFEAGEAYVIFGTASGFGIEGAGRRVVDLTTLDSSQGFIVQGVVTSDRIGFSVSSAGDINGDGRDDLVLGAIGRDEGGENAGGAYVIFGLPSGLTTDASGRLVMDLADVTASRGFFIQGETAGQLAGYSVSSAGDINGDGFDDIIVGSNTNTTRAGTAYVIFGNSQGFGTDVSGRQVIELADLAAGEGFVIQSGTVGDQTGFSVSDAGDVNGDGFDDLIVGAPCRYSADRPGGAYVIFGTADGFGVEVDGRQTIDLNTLGAAQGFIIQGDAAGDYAGYSVSSAGDINGDGLEDLLVGATQGSAVGAKPGKAYVIFGSVAGFGADVGGRQILDLNTLTASQGFIIQGDVDNDSVGWSVSSADDVNGDGFDDLIVGTPRNDNAAPDAGEAYILYGGTFGSGTTPIGFTGSAGAEILMGNAGDDTLAGRGGADIYRAGAGNDRIELSDAGFRMIDAGSGNRDVVVFAGSGFTLDARDFSNGQLTGIEGFDLTRGDNTLKLAAIDVFNFSSTGNGLFTGAESHNSLVIDGNGGDLLQLFEQGAANATWQDIVSARQLDGTAGGDYAFISLIENGSGRVLAALAVDQDIIIELL